MKTKKLLYVLAIAAIAVGQAAYARAQSGGVFAIQKSVVANGGGRVSGGSFTVESTVGQSLAGVKSDGAGFTILSGFWASGAATATVRRAPFDFDGDGKTDIGIFRP